MNPIRHLALALVFATGIGVSTFAQAQSFIGGSQISPSTSLGSVSGFTINQIADGITSDASPFNGFASNAASGTITLDLNQSQDLSAFVLWNDINVFAEGIAHFRLDFFDSSLNPEGSSTVFLAPKGQLAPATFTFANQSDVKRVNLVVLDSNVGVFTRIEIREVGFLSSVSVVPEPSISALLSAGLLGFTFLAKRRLRQNSK